MSKIGPDIITLDIDSGADFILNVFIVNQPIRPNKDHAKAINTSDPKTFEIIIISLFCSCLLGRVPAFRHMFITALLRTE